MPTKHSHEHHHCSHDRLRYCSHCQRPYCLDCGQEWYPTGYTWYYTSPTTITYPASNPIYTTCEASGTADASVSGMGACSHVVS